MKKFVKVSFSFGRHFSTRPSPLASAIAQPIPVITCKRQQFNLYQHDLPADAGRVKLGDLPLASDGWRHRKSNGDYFIIHPVQQAYEAYALSKGTFSELGIREMLVENLKRQHVLFPTHYQVEGIQTVLDGSHALLAAETGCGKTYTYLLPILEQILRRKLDEKRREFNTPLVLIITPGRELAQQIGNVAKSLTEGLGITTRVVLGGRTKQQMLNPSFEDIDILVASFGAISKLVTSGIYRMEEIRYVVLDEADTLLDDSFNNKLLHLMKRFPFHKNHLQDLAESIRGTQLILAAATMPSNMEELLSKLVNVATIEQVISPNLHRLMSHVTQRFMRVRKSDRPQILLDLVQNDKKRNVSTIIFSNKTPACDFVSLHLNGHGYPCVNLNGDMMLKLRLGQFEKFQQAEVNILSTTDVASRGLNTIRAAHVINFDFPLYTADYIHRVGRIGRIGSRSDCLVTNLVSSQAEIGGVQRLEHAARTTSPLRNVDANVKGIIRKNILKRIEAQEGGPMKV
ncbi:probable ATP-dependent RNA helicase DDX28 [Anopheles ziemanni]|uniref:probable ATP-dependent RNA helicase DDX28 n=1 Tax=Anopheles coustani TaxID=139045 RepID=UPI002659B67B|nr:probable ATP-dependent RNA helicase DDX28 [Anopheles coustani]XP_058174439.1 probable ATP-dependent RNA helicase DDX28 [Anopheles ziemanni]